jgi:hypothetical protein
VGRGAGGPAVHGSRRRWAPVLRCRATAQPPPNHAPACSLLLPAGRRSTELAALRAGMLGEEALERAARPAVQHGAQQLLPLLQAAGLLVSQPALEGELLPAAARTLGGALRGLPLRVLNKVCQAPDPLLLLEQVVVEAMQLEWPDIGAWLQAMQPDWPACCASLRAALARLQAVQQAALQAALTRELGYSPAEVEAIGTRQGRRRLAAGLGCMQSLCPLCAAADALMTCCPAPLRLAAAETVDRAAKAKAKQEERARAVEVQRAERGARRAGVLLRGSQPRRPAPCTAHPAFAEAAGGRRALLARQPCVPPRPARAAAAKHAARSLAPC